MERMSISSTAKFPLKNKSIIFFKMRNISCGAHTCGDLLLFSKKKKIKTNSSPANSHKTGFYLLSCPIQARGMSSVNYGLICLTPEGWVQIIMELHWGVTTNQKWVPTSRDHNYRQCLI